MIGWPPKHPHVTEAIARVIHLRRMTGNANPEYDAPAFTSEALITPRERVHSDERYRDCFTQPHCLALVERALKDGDVPPDVTVIVHLARGFFMHAELEAFTLKGKKIRVAVMADALELHCRSLMDWGVRNPRIMEFNQAEAERWARRHDEPKR